MPQERLMPKKSVKRPQQSELSPIAMFLECDVVMDIDQRGSLKSNHRKPH